MDVADVQALLGPEGQELLRELQNYDEASAITTGERLRRHHPAHLVALAMTQARLRHRAREKFGRVADRLLLTSDGLEQATRSIVAQRHAQRFRDAGTGHIVDLCCGIGADLLALADAGLDVTGVDNDPVVCALAEANTAALGLAHRVSILCADATTTDLDEYDGIFCDPARRAKKSRRLDPARWSPPWSFVRTLFDRRVSVGVKVAPGIDRDLAPAGVETEWVSVAGDLVEAALWSGPVATNVRRRATLVASETVTLTGTGDEGLPPVGPPARFLYEPDDAIIRAGLVSVVTDAIGGHLLDPTIAYVSSDAAVDTPLATRYEISDALPFQLKRLRAALRHAGVGHVVVKKRGSALDPEQLRRQLRLDGAGATATVVLCRVAGEPWALLTHPSPTAAGGLGGANG